MRLVLLSKLVVPFHLAFIAAYLVCAAIVPGEILYYLPLAWFIAGLFEMALLFPFARKGEDAKMARIRSSKAMRSDPVFLLGVVSCTFVLFQTLNGPRKLIYNTELSKWSFTSAPLPIFPSCLDQLLSVESLFWALLVICSLSVIRNAIGKKGRHTLIVSLVVVSSLLAIYGLVDYAIADSHKGFAFFKDSVVSGVYFFMSFCLSCAVFLKTFEQESRSKMPRRLALLSVILNFLAVAFSRSAMALVATAFALIAIVVYGVIHLKQYVDPAHRVKMFGFSLIIVFLAIFMHLVAYPKNNIHKVTDKIFSGHWRTERQVNEAEVLTSVASGIFKDNIVVGMGVHNFSNSSNFAQYVEDNDWSKLRKSKYYEVGNDFLQFLSEFGILGTLVVFSPILYLVFIILRSIITDLKPKKTKDKDSTTSSDSESDHFVVRYNPVAFVAILALIPPFVISFFHSVFRDPAIIYLWVSILAVLSCSLPKSRRIPR